MRKFLLRACNYIYDILEMYGDEDDDSIGGELMRLMVLVGMRLSFS